MKFGLPLRQKRNSNLKITSMKDMKLEFIKNQLADEKLKAELNKVVSSVEALIPESEEEFNQLQKFGLYPVEECVPFITKQGTPFYSLDNMSVLPLKEQG